MNKKLFVGYYESWCAEDRARFCEPRDTTNPNDLQLAHVAPYVNMVIVSFMKPDTIYQKNSFEISKVNTGLEFNGTGQAVKGAIQLLRNRGTKVLVSVGGSSYSKDGDFEKLNPQAIADVVEDFEFDGVDICFEPHSQWSDPPGKAKCERGPDGKITCNTDTLYRQIVTQVRETLPRGKILAVSAWSTGAYGEGEWLNSQPDGLLTGLLLNLLRSPEAKYIDQLNVMSYEAGSIYNPKEALAAYQNYFNGTIVMGIQVPPEGWPEESKRNVYTIPKVRELTQEVINRNADGMMLWTLQRGQEREATENNPNAEMISQEICRTLALGNCEQPLFSN